MVTTFYPPYHFGGDGVFVRALAQALTVAGHHVEVVHCEDAYCLRKQTRPIETRETDGITVHRLRSRFGSLSPLVTQQTGKPGLKTAALRSILNREFDVVNFHNISLIGGPGILALSRAPVNLYTVHEHWLLCPLHTFWKNRREPCDRPQCVQCCLRSGIPPQFWRYTRLIERSLGKIDLLLSPSHYTAMRHRAAGIRVPMAVLPSFTNIAPTPSPSRSARPYFLFAGRVTASKGIVSLIEEFSSLPDHDLWIAGDGDLRLELQTKYAQRSNVRFLGAVPHDELVRLYGSATALVLPSLAPEVFPLSILEAFACGTPAIVHDAGGSREAVDQTGGGVVYESTSDLRRALRSLACDTTLRDDLGRRARNGYEHYYSQERYIQRYLDLITGVQQKPRTPRGGDDDGTSRFRRDHDLPSPAPRDSRGAQRFEPNA